MAGEDPMEWLSSNPQVDGKVPPAKKTVDWLHGQASTSEPDDMHHKLGFGRGDAAAGDHDHDGVNSHPLWRGLELAPLAPTATNAEIVAALNKVIEALLKKSTQI